MIIVSCDVTVVFYIPFGPLAGFEIRAHVEGLVVFADKGEEGKVRDCGKGTFVVQSKASSIQKLFLSFHL
jgi:hypothetical protein